MGNLTEVVGIRGDADRFGNSDEATRAGNRVRIGVVVGNDGQRFRQRANGREQQPHAAGRLGVDRIEQSVDDLTPRIE